MPKRPLMSNVSTTTLTTEQVLERTCISRETLFAWVRKGYIAKPQTGKVPQGRGRRAGWPVQTVDQINELNALSTRGIPLHIAKWQIWVQGQYSSSQRYEDVLELAQYWTEHGSAGGLPERLGLSHKSASLRECFVFAIARLATLAGLDDRARERVEWGAAEHLRPALMNFVMGHDPSVVVTPLGSFILPAAALGGLCADEADDGWIPLSTSGVESPAPHEQRPSERMFPAFTVLHLGGVMRTLWREFGTPDPELHYQYAPVVWQRVDNQLYENDATLTHWARRPFAYVLDVDPRSARPVPHRVGSAMREPVTDDLKRFQPRVMDRLPEAIGQAKKKHTIRNAKKKRQR